MHVRVDYVSRVWPITQIAIIGAWVELLSGQALLACNKHDQKTIKKLLQ